MSYIPSDSSIVSTANSTSTALGANLIFTGATDVVLNYAAVIISIYSDVAGSLSVQWSTDNSNWDITKVTAISAGVAKDFVYPNVAKDFRIVYTNGAAAQTAFRLLTILSHTPRIQTV